MDTKSSRNFPTDPKEDFKDRNKQRKRALGITHEQEQGRFDYVQGIIYRLENENPDGIELDELDSSTCRWPVYRKSDGVHLFCGEQVENKSNLTFPYCTEHKERAISKNYSPNKEPISEEEAKKKDTLDRSKDGTEEVYQTE